MNIFLTGSCREETSDEVAVLHYTYNKFDDLKSRRDRCDCAPTEDDAKRCFILPFDRMVIHFLRLVCGVTKTREGLPFHKAKG